MHYFTKPVVQYIWFCQASLLGLSPAFNCPQLTCKAIIKPSTQVCIDPVRTQAHRWKYTQNGAGNSMDNHFEWSNYFERGHNDNLSHISEMTVVIIWPSSLLQNVTFSCPKDSTECPLFHVLSCPRWLRCPLSTSVFLATVSPSRSPPPLPAPLLWCPQTYRNLWIYSLGPGVFVAIKGQIVWCQRLSLLGQSQ